MSAHCRQVVTCAFGGVRSMVTIVHMLVESAMGVPVLYICRNGPLHGPGDR